MPDGAMRVVHVNDVAGVASAAIAQARADGLDWRLWPLPSVRGAPTAVKLARRARDVVRFHVDGRAADVLHVHYGMFAYYAWSVCRPYLLHLHGTDVRHNLGQRALGRLVRAGIRHAGIVAYSTPDLAAAVRELRPDAVWLPAPVSRDAVALRGTAPGPGRRAREGGAADLHSRIVFASRWDPVKGLDALLDTASRLRRADPDLRLIGVDWGSGAGAARRAGVELVPRMPPAEFRALLATADVVIGQLESGCFGVTDLEAMVMERPLVARFTADAAYGDRPPLWNSDECDPVDAVLAVVADPVAAHGRAVACAEWALRHHSPERFVSSATDLYRRLTDERHDRARRR